MSKSGDPRDVQVQLLDLLDQSYAAAEDSAGFEGFRIAADLFLTDAMRTGGANLADGLDAALGRHADRVERMTHDRALASPEAAAFAVLTFDARIERVDGNAAAAVLLGVTFPLAAGALGFEREVYRRLRDVATGVRPASTLRLERVGAKHPLPAIAARQSDGRVRLSLADVNWTPDLLGAIGGVLDLTERETAVLHGLLAGLSQAQIAERTGRSTETIKAQCKAILRKSGCRQMADVLQLASALGYLHRTTPGTAGEIEDESLMRDGRRISWRRYGARAGLPVVLHHAHLRGPFLTGGFAFGLARAGITVYAPSRPGYGCTDPTPDLEHYHREAARDVVALMDHQGQAEGITLLGFHGGSIAACHAQRALGGRATGMVLVGGQLPGSLPQDSDGHHVSMRIARAALTHTPQLMAMFFRLSMSRYKGDAGARRFYAELLDGCDADLAALDDPEILGLLTQGGLHAAGLSARSMIADARANVSDWARLFAEVSCPIHMILGAQDKVTQEPLARRWLARNSNMPLDVLPEAGGLLLYTHWPDILPVLRRMCEGGGAARINRAV